jgi:hypothetical protein
MHSQVTPADKAQQTFTIAGADETANLTLQSVLDLFNNKLSNLAHSRIFMKPLSSHVKVTLNDNIQSEKDKELALVNANDYRPDRVEFQNEIQMLFTNLDFKS